MKENQIKLSTEPYKGMRDFYPEDMAIQNYIFRTMSEVVEKFGYVEYAAPILEYTDLYRAKTGEEIVNEQTYSFTDRGGRDITMRPEMTPTVARMVAAKRKELTFPLRWYSIPNLFRYERPQRGRLREHFQLNVDIFGVENVYADEEIIQVAYDLMKKFGAGESSFIIKINDRRIVNYMLRSVLKLEEDEAYKLSKLIDRKDKISPDEFKAKAEEIIGTNFSLFSQVLEARKLSDLPNELKDLDAALALGKVIEDLNSKGIGNVIFTPSLMRGFDYYTKMVFEVFDTSPQNNRSLFGGGRYDDLVSLFGVEQVPGVGFGMGDVTIRDYLETYNLMPKDLEFTVDLYICNLGTDFIKSAQQLADVLRDAGLKVAVDLTESKLAAQVKTADKQGSGYVVCIGDDEIKNKVYKLKSLKDGSERSMSIEEVAKFLTT